MNNEQEINNNIELLNKNINEFELNISEVGYLVHIKDIKDRNVLLLFNEKPEKKHIFKIFFKEKENILLNKEFDEYFFELFNVYIYKLFEIEKIDFLFDSNLINYNNIDVENITKTTKFKHKIKNKVYNNICNIKLNYKLNYFVKEIKPLIIYNELNIDLKKLLKLKNVLIEKFIYKDKKIKKYNKNIRELKKLVKKIKNNKKFTLDDEQINKLYNNVINIIENIKI